MAGFHRGSDEPSPFGPSPQPPEEPPTRATTPAPPAYPPPGPPIAPSADPGPPPPPPLGDPQPISPWAPPPGAYSSAVPGAQGLQYGRTLDRVMAYLLDALIVTIPVFIAAFLVGTGVALGGMGEGGLNLVAGIVGSGIHLLYFVSFWTGSARATLGMRLMKLQIADARTGDTLTVQQGLARWLALGGAFQLLELVPPLLLLGGLLAFAWDLALLATTAASPTKQGLHDRIANTALVQPAGAQTPAVTCLVIAVALFALWVVGVVLVLLSTGFAGILSAVGTSV
ncbi:MAG: RDD family protein [Candidatus Limnocylindrales bacterium]